MAKTGVLQPDDEGREEVKSEETGDVAGESLVDIGKAGARRKGKALGELMRSAGSGAVSGTARYFAERAWKEFFGD